MRSFEATWESIGPIKGWLTEAQARMLYDAARVVGKNLAIVEIGSHHGRSTAVLASAADEGVSVTAIDPYGNPRWGGGAAALEQFRINLARQGLTERVSLVRDYGADVGRRWSGPAVGLLYVDGAHDYASVRADLDAWRPHLSPRATVIMHDAFVTVGVTRAVIQHAFFGGDLLFMGNSRSMVRLQRGPGSRWRSSGRMLARMPWFARNLGVKYARRRRWRWLERLLGSRPGQPLA
jgi:predicted O-methyltransferase YrrM